MLPHPILTAPQLLKCAVMAMALVIPPPALAADPPPLMIVLDGSGSMWGRLEGDRQTRLQAAREALRKALPALPRSMKAGFSSFGHRRKGDCSDVETLIEPAPLDAEAILAAADRLNPKGKGPLVLAMREAASELSGGEIPSRAHVMLIHDGVDNCHQDACAAADEIAKSQPGLAIHTIGLGLPPEDAARIACIATRTGGRAFNARTAAEIDEAIGIALAMSQEPAPPPAPVAVPAPRPAQRPALPTPAAGDAADLPPGLHVLAALTADGGALDAPIRWRVFKGDGGGPPIHEIDAPRLNRDLAPGAYVVEARLGLASARQKLTVADRPAPPSRMSLEAGVVTPAARTHKDGDIVEGAIYSIREVKPVAGGRTAKPLWIGRTGGSDIVLPTGTYIVRAETGLVVRDETVTLTAGSRKPLDIILGSGRLELSAALTEDGPAVDNVMYIVTEDDPDQPRGLREVARSAAPRPTFVLPAGTYYVTARIPGGEARQRVAIGAGDVVKRTIPLGLARLDVATRLETPPGATRPAILTRVMRVDDDKGEAARSALANPSFMLPPGRYRVSAQAGSQNARAERIVDVKPKEETRLVLAFDAGHVSLKLREGVAAALDQFWEIRDGAGQVVWRTTQSEARMTLAPGHYTATAEWRGRRLETAFDVAPGERKALAIGPE